MKGQTPWQVQLVGPFLCGGTITAPRIVITANHCVDNAMNPGRWSVQAGHIEKVKMRFYFKLNFLSQILGHYPMEPNENESLKSRRLENSIIPVNSTMISLSWSPIKLSNSMIM